MNRNDKRPAFMNSSGRSMLLFTAILLTLIALVVLFFALRGNWFGANGNSGSDEQKDEDFSSGIPDMYVNEEEESYYSYIADITEDPLQYVHECDSYVRDVLVYYVKDDKRSERFTITKQGEKYRIDADNAIRICDGEQLYINFGVNYMLTEAKPFYEEVGITSLDTIKDMLQKPDEYTVQYAFTDSQKRINFSIEDAKNNIKMEFQITLETGIVYAEQYYYNGVLYKVVYTDSLTSPAAVDEKIFSIPE